MGIIVLGMTGSLLHGGTLYKSVADFGADGSGTHDDTEAIQKAIHSLDSTGGVIFFPAGKYTISDTLVIDKGGVTLLGEGRGGRSGGAMGTNLILNSTKTSTAILMRDCAYSGVRNLVLYGAGNSRRASKSPSEDALKTSAPKEEPPGKAAIEMDGTYHCFLKEVVITSVESGIEINDGISPILEDIDLKDLRGTFGIWIHGSGGLDAEHRKVDAAVLTRIMGGGGSEDKMEWLVMGPNVDGATVMYARFIGGSHALVLRGGDEAKGDTRPKYLHTYAFGSDHAANAAVLLEAGNDVFMTDTWIGQTKNADSLVIGANFTSGVELVNTRIRGAGGAGIHVMGGQYIYISNSLIGSCGGNRSLVPDKSNTGCGVLIDAAVKHLRITGGCVLPFSDAGSKSQQYYGVRYLGSDQDAIANSVRISGVDTTDNPVPFEPGSLSLDKTP